MTDESILGDQTMNSSTLKKLSVSIPLVLMFAGICAGAEAGHTIRKSKLGRPGRLKL